MMTTRRKPGFTLVELIIVVAILVMMLAVAMPLFFQVIAQRKLTGAVARVAADLRYVQSHAVTQGGLFRVHHGDDAGQAGKYRLEQSSDGGTTWVATPGQSAWISLSSEYQGSSLQSIKDNDGAGATRFWVRFNAQGAADNPGFTYPIKLTVVAQSGATGTVTVLRTGAVRVP